MPRNVSNVTEPELKQVALPTHGESYTVVSHGFVIDKVKEELENHNFSVKDMNYSSNLNGEVAQGTYQLNYSTDDEIGLMFAWGNSYDKTMRFRCAIGAYVFVCGNGMIQGDMSNYGRKHTGDAKDQVADHIKMQISNASKYYKQLVADKNVMKTITLSKENIATLLGKLYVTDDVITSGQLITIKEQMKKPSYDYGTGEYCLWTIYNHITYALKKSHPKTWMESQKDLHTIVRKMFFPTAPVADPNQLDLAEEAEKAEAENNLVAINEFQPVEMSEDDFSSQLYGVDNNAESVIAEPEVATLDAYLGTELEESTEVSDEVEETETLEEEVEPEVEEVSEPATDETGLLFLDEEDDGDEPSPEVQMETEDPDDMTSEDYETEFTDDLDPDDANDMGYNEEEDVLKATAVIEEEEKASDNPLEEDKVSSEESDMESPEFEF